MKRQNFIKIDLFNKNIGHENMVIKNIGHENILTAPVSVIIFRDIYQSFCHRFQRRLLKFYLTEKLWMIILRNEERILLI